ncbi:MAG: ABC transporter ATP-binding protein [Gomphosphaeria aponina SAG 52.96 = DSM 107014]|uniref:ABC transporter ATP-binding protein n=1 Tax=Gomphosphaeria aponina SAG 52.96 = DSM 107014 TaxID=1521640 RepID=A0A941GU53_9CHRO|nr:ABC transporter ATP-binding protein [Gomphosphaeria aponina SAG 52.96 = DSM 107014]
MLEIKNLTKYYGKVKVLEDLNLYIQTGTIYGLLGPNGSGKTTTINLICNLLQADSGIIKINNQIVSDATKAWIGVATQENLLYKTLSCAENLDFYARIYGLKGKKRARQIKTSLTAVKLLERAKSPVETLSGGMQRRVNIAVALVHEPKLIILDEPTAGLDIETRYEIWELILNLKRQGMTVLLTTHLLDEAQRLCDRLCIIHHGKIIAEGSLSELRQLFPAQEIVLIKTEAETKAIAIAQQLGFLHRRYGGDLAFLLPYPLELKEIIALFDGIPLHSLTRQSVQLEHIYLEVTQNY